MEPQHTGDIMIMVVQVEALKAVLQQQTFQTEVLLTIIQQEETKDLVELEEETLTDIMQLDG